MDSLKIVSFKDQELYICKEVRNLWEILLMGMRVGKASCTRKMGKLRKGSGKIIIWLKGA